MEKPTTEFFESLGQYVYKYIDDESNVLYVGKGRGNRCLWHLDDKGYNIEHCYIVARNLEAFENKKDWQSFLLESWIIATEAPKDNSVSGHYKECFVMASLSSLFSDWKDGQHDNFESFPEWYVENYDRLRGRLRAVQLSSNNMYIESNTRNSINCKWYVSNVTDPIKVMFEVYTRNDEEKNEFLKSKVIEFFKLNGYKKYITESNNSKLSVECKNIEAVLDLFDAFNA